MILSRYQQASLNGMMASREKMLRTGLTGSGDRIWTDDEVETLREFADDRAAAEAALPHRTPAAIGQKTFRLGLRKKRNFWTARQVLVVRPAYPTVTPVSEIAGEAERSPKQVYGKAQSLRLRRPRRRPVAVSDSLVHAIRQRAFELNIALGQLDRETNRSGYFLKPTKRRKNQAISLALEMLGGKVRPFE